MDNGQKKITFEEAISLTNQTAMLNGRIPDYILIGRETLYNLMVICPVMHSYSSVNPEFFMGIPLERVEALYRFEPVYKGRF